jgi:hypothetical protein
LPIVDLAPDGPAAEREAAGGFAGPAVSVAAHDGPVPAVLQGDSPVASGPSFARLAARWAPRTG